MTLKRTPKKKDGPKEETSQNIGSPKKKKEKRRISVFQNKGTAIKRTSENKETLSKKKGC